MPYSSPDIQKEYQKRYKADYKKQHTVIGVTVSKDEYRHLSKLAKRDKLSVPKKLKQMAFAYDEKKYIVPEDIHKRLDIVIFLLRNIGNNINQIARERNTNILYGTDYQDRMKILTEIFSGLSHLERHIIKSLREPAYDYQVNE